ncbi:hypothetical protein BJ875DRAFT_43995 [Amylocarpus encephaloides]|uniref:Uncharacterized protein n=1 Tax=Amylocarpus encephaloides TaxID=45428 RepID=A0A9P7YGJ2_9HELO|nr:hypothetical protein BJ875DRAFT_43995 [Amylocarpus encephaloides]
MDSLAPELIDRIVSYLDCHDEDTLTLSRKFQVATERERGWWRKHTVTNSNAEMFLKAYSSHRIHNLEEIIFRTSLPPLELSKERQEQDPYEPPTCRDSVDDLKAMDEEFTKQINHLFATLKTLENSTGGEAHAPQRIKLTIYTPTREVDLWHCISRKYVSWRIHLLAPETLPNISMIRALSIVQEAAGSFSCAEAEETSAKLDSRIVLDISAKLPNLEDLECKLREDEWTTSLTTPSIKHYTRSWEGPHRDSRNDFAKAFQTCVLPASLKEVRLNFGHGNSMPEDVDQRQPLPNLVKPALYDLFSTSLRLFSHQLRILQLVVVADETLFWPNDGSEASWPNLESINIMFHMATPKGGCYFHGLHNKGRATEGFEISASSYPPLGPEENDEVDCDEDQMDWTGSECVQFRVVPHNEVLLPFLTAFAKSAINMRFLKEAVLWSPLAFAVGDLDKSYAPADYEECLLSGLIDQNDEYNQDEWGKEGLPSHLSWGVVYVAPNEYTFSSLRRDGPGESYLDSRQLWWKVGKWRPDAELHNLFQQIGKNRGEKLIEYWEDNCYGSGLVDKNTLGRCDIDSKGHSIYIPAWK